MMGPCEMYMCMCVHRNTLVHMCGTLHDGALQNIRMCVHGNAFVHVCGYVSSPYTYVWMCTELSQARICI
jgi:hypothetical protein